MAEIVGIGSAVFDTLMTVNRFPLEDTKIQSAKSHVQGGGPCATALVAASKLGVRAAYCGTLGADIYGRMIFEGFEKYGVDTTFVKQVPGESFHAVILLNTAKATRTCVWSKGSVPPPTLADIPESLFAGARFLHLDGHHLDASIYAAQRAHALGVKVSLDAGGVYPNIEQLLPFVNVLIPSEEFALTLTGCSTAERAASLLMERYHPETLIITQGMKGGFRWTAQGAVRYPDFAVKAVDTNGAGDTFHGAFLAGRVKGMSETDAASFASAVSALKCTRLGAQEGIPSFTEALAFWSEKKKHNKKEC